MPSTTRAAIFDTFHALMMTRRYSQISVQDICREARVSRSSFYTHFPDRRALLLKTVEPMLEDLIAGLLDPARALKSEAAIAHIWEQRRLAELWRDPVIYAGVETLLRNKAEMQGLRKEAALFVAAGITATLKAWVAGSVSMSSTEMHDHLAQSVQAAMPPPGGAPSAPSAAPAGRQ